MKKQAFALRVSPAVLEKLEKWAADDFRSVNGQIEWILDQALRKAGRHKSPVSNAEAEQSKGKEVKNQQK
jgi:hypothetical protein